MSKGGSPGVHRDEVGDAGDRARDVGEARILAERRNLLQRDGVDPVEFAGRQSVDAALVDGQEAEGDRVEMRQARLEVGRDSSSSVMWSPCTHSTNVNGPVPTGLRAGSPLSIAFLLTIWPLVARFVEERAERRLEMEDGHGRIGRVDQLDLRVEPGIGAGRLRIEDALEAVLHIGRGEVLAIVEGGIGDELELPGLRVDLRP